MADMTPAEAAAVLQRAEGYEETLTNRTAGMTNMVWGTAAAIIFLTYGTAGGWLDRIGSEWAYTLLWIPGVALGSIFTAILWHSHAVTLRHPMQARQGFLRMALSVLLFFGFAAALYFGLRRLDFDWEISAIMTIVNGFFAFAMARFEANDAPLCAKSTYGAGAFMLTIGIALGFTGWGPEATALAGAATTALGWGGAGLWTVLRS